MDELLKILKALLPGHSDKVYKGIISMLGLEGASVATTADDNTEGAVTIAGIAKSLSGLGYKVQLPGMEQPVNATKGFTPPYETNPITPANAGEDDDEDDDDKTRKSMTTAFFNNRSGDRNVATKTIMSDLLGTEYRQTIYDQNVAFAKYLRTGKDDKILHRQFFPEDAVMKAVLDEGLDVATIKATQVEAQGELGGIAVPPNRQTDITTRLPGLTAVRGAGATVITLVNSNSVEIPQWRTDDTTHRYIGMLRGEWGNETKSPNAKNFKLDMVPVVANIYTYKVPFSQSLVDDASNLVTMLMNDITITAAMDEDECFLVGDGVGKPHGILPGGANVHGLKEVVTGDADELTVLGIKALKRGIPTQYRRNCVWVGNSQSFGVIESMKVSDSASMWAFPDLSEEDQLLGRTVYETEAMPDYGANAYPLLFAWMMGYDIVERLGMTIQRFQDSATGPNIVEYHLRKRVGGRLERPWMFALQKCATGDPFS